MNCFSRRHAGLLLSLLGALGACDDERAATPEVPQLEVTYAQLVCEQARSCTAFDSWHAPLFGALARQAGPGSCDNEVLQGLESQQHVAARIASGALVLDADQAEACFAALRACHQPEAEPACRAFLRGKVALGEACTDTMDCDGDAYCKPQDGCTGGLCTARTALAASCQDAPWNGDYDACSVAAGPAVCSALGPQGAEGTDGRVCRPVLYEVARQAGDACGEVLDGDTLHRIGCPTGTDCAWLGGVARTCRVPSSAGQACGPDRFCGRDLVCVYADAKDPGTCVAPKLANRVGAVCGAASGVTCNPLDQLICGQSNHCVAIDSVGVQGDVCLLDGYGIVCNEGLSCQPHGDAEVGWCQPQVGDDQPCTSDDLCASGLCDETGRCAAAAAVCGD